MKRASPGAGSLFKGARRIVVGFDPDTFEQIRARAVKDGVSFATVLRELVEWGLEA